MSLIFCCDYIVLMTSYHITGFCSLLKKIKGNNMMARKLREEPCCFSRDFERQQKGLFFFSLKVGSAFLIRVKLLINKTVNQGIIYSTDDKIISLKNYAEEKKRIQKLVYLSIGHCIQDTISHNDIVQGVTQLTKTVILFTKKYVTELLQGFLLLLLLLSRFSHV